MNKDKYRLGVVFRTDILDSVPGFVDIKEDVSLLNMLRLTVRFLTTEVRSVSDANLALEGIEDLVYDLYDIRAISEHLYENEDTQLKLVQIFTSVCRMLIDLFADIGYYEDCQNKRTGRPCVGLGRNPDHFIIYVRRSFVIN